MSQGSNSSHSALTNNPVFDSEARLSIDDQDSVEENALAIYDSAEDVLHGVIDSQNKSCATEICQDGLTFSEQVCTSLIHRF